MLSWSCGPWVGEPRANCPSPAGPRLPCSYPAYDSGVQCRGHYLLTMRRGYRETCAGIAGVNLDDQARARTDWRHGGCRNGSTFNAGINYVGE